MSASDVQRAPISYPDGWALAVTPDAVDASLCTHEDDDPACFCVHDWRIHWGNMSRQPKAKATYVS